LGEKKKQVEGDDKPVRPEPPAGDRPTGEARRERRSKHRVADDQGTGKGALTALSKMQMLQRRRESIAPGSGDDDQD
jgi:hypothetical protein